MSKLSLVLFALAVKLWLVTPAAAQRLLDPDTCLTCWDSVQHFGSTAALNAGAYALFPKWKPWQRVVLTGVVIGAVFEAGQTDVAYNTRISGRRGYGFGIKDWVCDILGAVASEIVIKALR